jgi:acetate kinase
MTAQRANLASDLQSRHSSNILVFNCGSSSLTYKVFMVRGAENIQIILSGKANRVGVHGTEPSSIETTFEGKVQKDVVPIRNHKEAAALALKNIKDNDTVVDCIGHRFVHGGSHFRNSVFLDKSTLEKLKLCEPLAPNHNPSALSVIYESKQSFPRIPQFVTFDSAFHSSIPRHAYTYALPRRITEKFGFRKYGFHGLSYSYVIRALSQFLRIPLNKSRIVACHLGTGGSSVAAIKDARSIDTSMGYSPLPGLIMSTRCGDIDPMLSIYLMTAYGYRSDDLMELLGKKSGLLGISGFSSDIRDIIQSIDGREEQADLAFKMYIHRLKKYIGSYVAVLGGIDILVFTDDIGVHNWRVRQAVCENMDWCGLLLDQKLNRQGVGDKISRLDSENSKVHVFSVPTQEELVICLEGVKLLGAKHDIAV